MNKYTLYLPLFFALFALAGCEKEHTGYLFTENARYPIDSLKIIRYEDYNQEVIRLEEQLLFRGDSRFPERLPHHRSGRGENHRRTRPFGGYYE